MYKSAVINQFSEMEKSEMRTTHAPQCTALEMGQRRSSQVANTILDQLGGRRFMQMTGAKTFVATDEGLQFKLPRGLAQNGINSVVINLNPHTDLYNVYFHKIKGADVREVAFVLDVDAENLQRTFTANTNLETSLGTIGRYHPQ